ncbi:uncharacterized protein CcaverHIS019_0100640 [Cutaneotrichosporon cavernicola]|uniref:Oxidoreductase-like domain-containing protein n=1 Tax=Cutaneotrichosporon cavernicola TaxID=279322 RepID=A0AA48IAQ8_9TREE|nr:uncharacterized protein CcaverHIS019_0100640 [Cutaneotrichosporon cavernicola]BEI87346.1 hypothetical protein CcaverHIS019_0100640 [Cutaneotrichosporon cavernicola]BEI95116.1 hypothetical protein CcaverHIS631_0100650 [Cutaneotrichosporon cavernicola]BEJ02890.1 hypothetical protein CcaverHIS641_0100650 [Cutaneotrichosporon cavernicola]
MELTPDCCMSGCVHCVLQIYVDDMEEYNDAFDAARAALEHKNIPRGRWPKVMDEVDDAVEAPKMDPTMSAFAALEAKLAGKAAPPPKPRSKPAIDPGVAAFMALEAKIKNKHKSEA